MQRMEKIQTTMAAPAITPAPAPAPAQAAAEDKVDAPAPAPAPTAEDKVDAIAHAVVDALCKEDHEVTWMTDAREASEGVWDVVVGIDDKTPGEAAEAVVAQAKIELAASERIELYVHTETGLERCVLKDGRHVGESAELEDLGTMGVSVSKKCACPKERYDAHSIWVRACSEDERETKIKRAVDELRKIQEAGNTACKADRDAKMAEMKKNVAEELATKMAEIVHEAVQKALHEALQEMRGDVAPLMEQSRKRPSPRSKKSAPAPAKRKRRD